MNAQLYHSLAQNYLRPILTAHADLVTTIREKSLEIKKSLWLSILQKWPKSCLPRMLPFLAAPWVVTGLRNSHGS